jgi:hypothetical protein
LATFATSVPDVGDVGATVPTARLIMTPAKLELDGLDQDRDTDEVVEPVTFSEVTGAPEVVAVTCVPAENCGVEL